MNYLFVLSCLFAVCLVSIYGQSSSTARQTTKVQSTTRPTGSTASSVLKCVCSCCSGLGCKPVALQTFIDTTCTAKACKDKCKVFQPKDCNHTFLGTNDAYCTV